MNRKLLPEPQYPVRVLIVDDHVMVREGLAVMLSSFGQQLPVIITGADSGDAAIAELDVRVADLVIIDYQMPGLSGAETTARILRRWPRIKIMALSNYDELPYIQRMKYAGASGYVLKNIEAAEMLYAIKTILSGKLYYSNDVAVKLIDSGRYSTVNPQLLKTLLTSRELEILQMIFMEMTNDEIARRLKLAKRTVDAHRHNMIGKLQVKNTAGLIKAAMKLMLVE